MAEQRNCPNCAAPYDIRLNTCPYCGTSYFDMAAVKLDGKPIILKFCLDGLYAHSGGGSVFTAKAFISNATLHEEFTPGDLYQDFSGRLVNIRPCVQRRVNLEFIITDYIE